MEWTQKVEMVEASNNGDFNLFKDKVMDGLNTFDGQAWDMFFNCIELLESNMVNHKEFYVQVYRAMKNDYHTVQHDTSLRCVIRMCLFETILEDVWGITPPQTNKDKNNDSKQNKVTIRHKSQDGIGYEGAR